MDASDMKQTCLLDEIFYFSESSQPTIRYPVTWDLAKLIRRTHPVFLGKHNYQSVSRRTVFAIFVSTPTVI